METTFRNVEIALVAMLLALPLAGCATSATIEPDGNHVRHYIGYVKVVIPQAASQKAVYSSDVSVVGLRAGDGIGIGYARDRQVVVPLDCRVVVMVANQSQLDNALTKLPALVGSPGICAVVNPSIESGEHQ